MPGHPALNEIGAEEATRGTETSKYPEEEKSTEIPGVAASETGPAQTLACAQRWGVAARGVVGPRFPWAQSHGRSQKLDP